MTAFAACLFALAALASAWTLLRTVRRFGPGAATLRAQLEACPRTMTLEWKSVERLPALPQVSLADFRKRPARRMASGLEWPQVALELAA